MYEKGESRWGQCSTVTSQRKPEVESSNTVSASQDCRDGVFNSKILYKTKEPDNSHIA